VTLYREQLQQLYCLPEWMWNDWLNDEIFIRTSEHGSAESTARIRSLFEKALADYSYKKVHKLRVNWELSLPSNSAETIRAVFEDAVNLYGLDLNKSGKIWTLYLNFETQEDSEPDLQTSRIRSIFRRRCYFPTYDMQQAFADYSAWETDKAELTKVKARYEQALAKLPDYEAVNLQFKSAQTAMEELADITKMRTFLSGMLAEWAGDNFNYIQLFFE